MDFSKLTERRGSNSLKWDVTDGELPMWVADMDFQAASCITDAINKKARSGVYGYTIVPDEYYSAVCSWWSERHDFPIKKEWLAYSSGVMPAVASIIREMTDDGDNVLLQPPVYNMFYSTITNNNRRVVTNDLIYDGMEYRIDFEDLEQRLADERTKLMILCNPHNPIGKIWDNATIGRIGELCHKYNVIVLSDEIHGDLTYPEHSYTPFASISEICAQISVTCAAPTKTFNLAGLQAAYIIAPNELLRSKTIRGLCACGADEPNVFAVEATIAAYTTGSEWLDGLREYLYGNKRVVSGFIKSEIPLIKLAPGEATYLLWLDCGAMTSNSSALCRFLRSETGLFLSDGTIYGGNGNCFLRMNIACPRARVEDGLKRLKAGIELYLKRYPPSV